MSKPVTDADFEQEVLKSTTPVLVDFWAPWCGPCKAMNPIIEEVEAEYGDAVKFAKINVDDNNDYPGRYGVMSIPTFIIFKDGAPARSFVGSRAKEDFKKEIDAAIA